jgi:hypothetical protein
LKRSTLVSGIHYPRAAAGACGIFVLTRFFYTRTYSTGHPNKRATPARIGYFVLTCAYIPLCLWLPADVISTVTALIGTSIKVAYDLIVADI